jgi:hypothetical protein
MPRKRQPFVIDGQTVECDSPGLKVFRGKYIYWVADPDAVRGGFTPKSVRLHYDLRNREQVEQLSARCRGLWNEMLQWLEEPERKRVTVYDGSLGSLIRLYQTDPESPYQSLRQSTQRCYDDWLTALTRLAGKRQIVRLTGQDVRRWFNDLVAPAEPNGPPRVRHAIGCVKQMMPILLSYGAEQLLPKCIELAQVLEKMQLRVPRETRIKWRASRPKKVAMTFEHASAIVEAGLAKGTRRHRSVALGVAAQFEFTLRQIDVIGTWERVTGARGLPADSIAKPLKTGQQIWGHGLRFEDLVGTLDMSTSKTNTAVAFDPSAYPLVVRALAAVPVAERHGPLVTDESGAPVQRRYYVRLYDEVCTVAGVTAVWNMRARHGGVTEAHEAGADMVDIANHAQHSNMQTTFKHYIVGDTAMTRRVAGKRVEHRKKKEAG